MNKSVAHYISELLFLHDCVIVPDFGGFVGNKKPAQLNKTTGALAPPSKQILFNTNLKTNDGLLITHIADQENVTQKAAKENVALFVKESNTKLSTSKVLRITKIGLFTVGREGNIIFLQDGATNYNLDTFGMKPTYNKLVLRKTETEKQAEATIKTIKSKSRNPKVLLRAAAVIIPLVALSYLSISQQEKINDFYTQMAAFNPFTKNKITEEIIENNAEETLVIEAIEDILIIEEEMPVIIPQKTHYIIAGAFAEQKNANRLLKKLKNSKYNPEILEGSYLLRVSYDSFYNREDAILALNNIKQENPDAWLFTK